MIEVQRGMEDQDAEGQRIQYIFVKPHAALDEQTPAQVAGIGIDGENKWMELLKKAIDSSAVKS